MDPELAAIKAAHETAAEAVNTAGGSHDAAHDKVRELADAYVGAHPDMAASYGAMTLEQCVGAVDVFRAANMEVHQWRVETWLLHKFEPQNIGGPAQAVLRVPNSPA